MFQIHETVITVRASKRRRKSAANLQGSQCVCLHSWVESDWTGMNLFTRYSRWGWVGWVHSLNLVTISFLLKLASIAQIAKTFTNCRNSSWVNSWTELITSCTRCRNYFRFNTHYAYVYATAYGSKAITANNQQNLQKCPVAKKLNNWECTSKMRGAKPPLASICAKRKCE